MKVLGAILLAVAGLTVGGMVIVETVNAQQRFAAETQAMADVNSTLGGTWTLKQRTNPDGTPYRSRLQGVTYISIKTRTGDNLAPHSVASVYSKESGIADTHFFAYPAEIANKPFTMESSGTWLVSFAEGIAAGGSRISIHASSMTKGDIPPYNNGTRMSVDLGYNLSRIAPTAGARAVPKLLYTGTNAAELTDLAGKRIETSLMTHACCGMTDLSIQGNTMEITWSNKGKDTWVKSSAAVPAAFR